MKTLILFAKYPEPGTVKTRLAHQVGESNAAELYRKMLERVIKRSLPSQRRYQHHLYIDPPERLADFRKDFPQATSVFPQQGNSLGARMKNAVEESMQRGSQKVILIGSDCLHVNEDLILQGFQSLEEHDLVLGPARDGGYYLIGLKKNQPELFSNIPWSTSSVLRETLCKAERLQLKTCILPEFSDIDTYEDLIREGMA